MKITNVSKLVLAAIVLVLGVKAEDNEELLYKNTKICARHKSKFCLSYNKGDNLVELDRRHKLRWDIEEVERVNMNLHRVYTHAEDAATGKKVKSCLVRTQVEKYGVDGLGLAPCDSDSKELVLALDTPKESKILLDEFVLKEISYLDSGNTLSSSMCLTSMHVVDGVLAPVTSRDEIKRNSILALVDCTSEYAQDFRARGFDRSASSRLAVTEEPAQVEAQIGRFCLTEQPGLCLGVSLENGEDLVSDVLVQVKDYAKNEAKDMHDLKMRWYHDLQNDRIATASQLDYCLEAIYGAYIGDSRSGKPRYDDIVHLGNCDASRSVAEEISEQLRNLPKSEIFYTKQVSTPAGSYMELRTDLPDSIEGTGPKCVSIVKCVRHDNGHCTKYNSVEVYNADELETGAYARLKDCDSENLVSQRWFYVADEEVTMPPTRYPTPKPETASPTVFPTPRVTNAPTPVSTEPLTDPPTNPPTDPNPVDDGETVTKKSPAAALTAGLAFVGILCIAVIIAAAAYYYKSTGPAAADPQEDENFIARV